eukprot:TRINITY_DN9677_c0_g8_i2.p1 TRINITY_DN9677_c0_g8~~TRINITY_DN9677_c0_g8_i2.p1  ORF type:complete len:135 (+),score=31.54 TRINITY_DN9677_c0_g8_i2:741-1145(+)
MHNGADQSRRDDMESLGYVLLYLAKGKLPWQGLGIESSKEKNEAIKKIKAGTSLEVLCEGCPSEFSDYIKHCRELNFEGKPEYNYLRKLFRDLYANKKFARDGLFDWLESKKPTVKKEKLEAERCRPISSRDSK